jgi:hypothetical protein
MDLAYSRRLQLGGCEGMKPTIHYTNHIWPCHQTWMAEQLANNRLQTAYEVRDRKPRRYESKELALSKAKRCGQPCWKVCFIKGRFKDAALYEELIPGKDC